MKQWARILSLLPLWAACLVAPAQAGMVSSLVVFGDSLSDNGQSLTVTGGSLLVSDGPVAVDYIREKLGVTVYKNYAVTGARTDISNSDTSDPNSKFYNTGVATQVDRYLSATVETDALHIISAGSNDVLDAVLTTDLTVNGAIDQLIASIVSNLAQSVGLLQANGASRILLALLPDMGLTPLASGPPDLSAELTLLSAAVNDGLSLAFAGSGVLLFDTLAAQQSELAAFEAAGGNVTSSCVADIALGLAANCDNYFFYDELHPTSAAHQALAQDVLAAIPEPAALGLTSLALLAVYGTRRRRI